MGLYKETNSFTREGKWCLPYTLHLICTVHDCVHTYICIRIFYCTCTCILESVPNVRNMTIWKAHVCILNEQSSQAMMYNCIVKQFLAVNVYIYIIRIYIYVLCNTVILEVRESMW